MPCCLRGSRSDSRAMAMTSATASTARPRTCPPSSRVLSGRESDVSVTGAPAGFGRAPVPTFGVAAGVTVGKSPPGSVGDGRKGSAAAEAAIPAGVRGGMPPGSVAPRPDGIPPDPEDARPDVAVGFADAVVEIVALAEAGAAAVAPVAFAVAVRVACWPVLAVFGTVTAASSSSAWPAASVATVQVAPPGGRQTENRGVIAAVTLALAVTVMLLAVPPDGQTQTAKLAVPPGCTEVATACTLTHNWTAGELAVGVGVGVGVGDLDGLGVGDGVVLALGLAELAVGLAWAVALPDGAAAGVLAVAVAVAAVMLGVGVAAAISCADEAESSRTSAELTATELSAVVAGCCPHVLVAAVVYADCVTGVPASNALTRPEVISNVPANTVSADIPARHTVMMAPLSSWSSRRDLACRHASSCRLCPSSIPSCPHSTPVPLEDGNRGGMYGITGGGVPG